MKRLDTNSKEVKTKVRDHIQEFMTPEELKETVTSIMKNDRRYDTLYHAVKYMAEGGSFLCYYTDVNIFLNSLEIIPEGKEYDDDASWRLYCHLIARDSELLIRHAKTGGTEA